MKDFDNSFLTLITAEQATTFWCVDLQIDAITHQYFTSLDIDIVHDGDLYQSSEFDVRPVNYGMNLAVDKIDLEFGNVDLTMSATLLNNTITGQPCIIYAGAVDNTDMSMVIEEVFRGLASEWTLDEKKARISIVDEFIFWNKKSLRKPDALCAWEFKGTECGYSGSATQCNRTYARCVVLGNSDSFGGFRFFPATEEKEVWWGKTS